ncbi:MAG: hypothetical protein R3C25_00420 [Hyphomonadaceae bacterium]
MARWAAPAEPTAARRATCAALFTSSGRTWNAQPVASRPAMAQSRPLKICGNGRPGIEARPVIRPETVSPSKPPKPVASGQPSGVGMVVAAAASSSTPSVAAPTRRLSMRATNCLRHTRKAPAASNAAIASGAAAPRAWIERSARTAPGAPNRLWVAPPVAVLRLGSSGE